MTETAKEIHDRMLTHIDESYDKSTGSFIWDVTKPGAIEFEIKNKEIQAVQDKMNVNNLVGDELERFVYQRTGTTRKHATRALTTVIVSGQEGAVIRQGDMFGTDTVNFLSIEDRVLGETGQVSIFVVAELPGSIGNVPENSITEFPVMIDGLVDVYNPEPVTNGF